MIPTQLKTLKFCRIQKGTKKPFEKDWTNKPYSYDEITLLFPMENYGVLCGYEHLAVIDADNNALQIAIEKMLPETFKVKTGNGGTHNYYFIPDLKQKIILETETGEHLGEVQSYGQQVVGPYSIHPNGSQYEPLNKNNILEISAELIYDAFKPFIKQLKETEENVEWERKEHSSIDDLNVADIWGTSNLKKHGSEYYGSHPIHGSDSGMNFWINPLKNLWHCFRCNSGGGPLAAIAVKEGLIDCSEAQRGNLRGSKVIEIINLAKEKYGLKEKEELAIVAKKEGEIEVVWDKDLETWEEEEKEWIVNRLIPNKSVSIITGKRGTMKTFVSLLLAYSVASGIDFLDKYPTKKGCVLYLDKENGLSIIKKRTKMIKQGLEIKTHPLKVGFICFSQVKIDKITDIKKIEELILEYKPKILIVDTYRRAISFDENDAGAVSELFVDILRPLVEKYNFSIILIHHNRKTTNPTDEMDEIRGSSDLANYADIIIKVERNGEKIIIKQLKNRNAKEEEPFQISTEFGEQENYLKICYEGVVETQTQESRGIEILTLWLTENKITHFKTKDAKEIAFKKGVKERNFNYALRSMEDLGIIKRVGQGKYETTNYKVMQ